MNNDSPFGKYVRDQRVKAKLSLRAVARELDISHVFLGEVERGIRGPLAKTHWAQLSKVVPGITEEALEQHAELSRPIQLSLSDTPLKYRNLALAVAQRIAKQDLSSRDVRQILRILLPERDDVERVPSEDDTSAPRAPQERRRRLAEPRPSEGLKEPERSRKRGKVR